MMRNVTGRDSYIIVQALAPAYALIGTLPDYCQEGSNRHDMGRVLRHTLGENWKGRVNQIRYALSEAEWKQGRNWQTAPDLFDDGPNI